MRIMYSDAYSVWFPAILKRQDDNVQIKIKETVSEGSMSSVISELNKKITPKIIKKWERR